MKTHLSRLHARKSQRSGIILLMVLTMLAIFSLLVASYVVFTSRSRIAAQQVNGRESREFDPSIIIEEAASKILAGDGSMLGLSLMEDYWGNDAIVGSVASNGVGQGRTLMRGQLLRFPINDSGIEDSDVPGILSGRILTFTDGPMTGFSVPIVDSSRDSNGLLFVVVDLTPVQSKVVGGSINEPLSKHLYTGLDPNNNTQWITNDAQTGSKVNELIFPFGSAVSIHINGRPQNGTGRLWTQTGGNWNDAKQSLAGFNNTFAMSPALLNDDGNSSYKGDEDEPFDVPDYHDPWLGFYPSPAAGNSMGRLAPSFVRPGLINYVVNLPQDNFSTSNPTNDQTFNQALALLKVLSRISKRPIPVVRNNASLTFAPELVATDYSNFTGSNENSLVTTPIDMSAGSNVFLATVIAHLNGLRDGTYDVDNNGDGFADSVWVPLGLPQFALPTGEMVKAMAAFRIEDLSARIDINASGNVEISRQTFDGSVPAGPYAGQIGNPLNQLATGAGYGPAELSLRSLFTKPATNNKPELALRVLSGRLGADGVPGVYDNDPVNEFRFVRRPPLHQFLGGNGSSLKSTYGMPVDVLGRGKIVLDVYGQPFVSAELRQSASGTTETFNDPYETDFDAFTSPDRPYTLAELEALLRMNDWSSNELPQALRELVDEEADFNANPNVKRNELRSALTTYSGSQRRLGASVLPSTNASSLTKVTVDPLTILARTIKGSGGPNQQIAIFERLLPMELRRGEPMDLNRPFGDGLDGNNNGVVDEPSERSTEKVPGTVINADYRPAPVIGSELERQIYARNLYTLAMMIVAPKNTPGLSGFDFRSDSASNGSLAELHRAQRLAQWAVNVVDFRDRDAIMTGFEYDVDPLDGWHVDGDLKTDDNKGSVRSGIVWGCEAPEAVLTESFACHDLGHRDTDKDNADQTKTDDADKPDDDTDQFRVPQGTMMLEVQSVRSPSTVSAGGSGVSIGPSPPPELYTTDNSGNVKLNLERRCPDGNPVWRVGVLKNTNPSETPDSKLNKLDYATYDSLSFRPELGLDRFNPLDPSRKPAFKFDRVIWFLSNVDPSSLPVPNDTKAERVYYNHLGNTAHLDVGGYAVIGSRRTTYIGSRDPNGTGTPDQKYINYHGSQKFSLSANSFGVTIGGQNLTGSLSPSVRPILGIVAAARVPAGSSWTAQQATSVDGDAGFGISVSEPLPEDYGIYTPPACALRSKDDITQNANGYPIDSWYDYDDPATHPYVKDTPFDNDPNSPIAGLAEGTVHDFATAYLQRLADPLRPYDSLANPYITVDWIPIDLTIFNGTETSAGVNYKFASRRKDGLGRRPDATDGQSRFTNNAGGGNAGQCVLWSYTTEQANRTQSQTSLSNTKDYFRCALGVSGDGSGTTSTLGYLNKEIGTPLQGTQWGNYQGSPTGKTFPWITWMNREFANPYEIMLVPASSPDRLMLEFSLPKPSADPNANNPFDAGDSAAGKVVFNDADHLLNFFSSSKDQATFENAPNLSLLFDYVCVPSPYDYGNTLINPVLAANLASSQGGYLPTLRAPFNVIQTDRQRGLINLNTIASPAVWRELMLLHSRSGENNGFAFAEFVKSRNPGAGSNGLDNRVPTQFPGAFVPASSAHIAPLLYDDVNYDPNNQKMGDQLRRPGIDGTLFRKYQPVAAGGADVNRTMLGRVSKSDNYADPARDAYFRYQTAIRTANLTTTNSQVYAVWVTVGYFDVDESSGVTSIGSEHGYTTGGHQRHRMFMIVDRSIPCAYPTQSKKDYEKIILLKRKIQ